MRSRLLLALAAVTASVILALVWLQLGERKAPLEPADHREPPPGIEAEPMESDRFPDAGAELESEAAIADQRAEAPMELPPEIKSDRPRSVRWVDYIEVEFVLPENRGKKMPGYFLPKNVVVYVEGVEEPHPLMLMGDRVRPMATRYYLTDYYKDEGWKISRVVVDDPRYRDVDLTLDPPLAEAQVPLFGSSEIEIEVIDSETREAISGWSAIAYSSSCSGGGSALLRSTPERPGSWAPVVAADYWVEVSHPEYSLGGVGVLAPPGGVVHAVAELSKSASVRGRVIFDDFAPAPGARVRLALPGFDGRALPEFGRSTISAGSNSIKPHYRWLATTESAEDGTFELRVSTGASLVIEATVADIRPQRVTVDAVAGQPISGVEIVIPRGLQLTGSIQGPTLSPGRRYLIRATKSPDTREVRPLEWDRDFGDNFLAAWAHPDGAFDLGPFPVNGDVKVHVLDAPESVDIFGLLEGSGARLLHTETVKGDDGVLEPLEIRVD